MSTSTPTPHPRHPQDAPLPSAPPASTDRPPTTGHSGHETHGRGHTWTMLLMCLPMVVLIGALVAAGAVGSGAVLYALGCIIMMGVMMLFMSGGHRH